MTLTHLFHNQGKGRPVGGGGEIIDWLLRDDFTDTLTAGNVNGTAATPGPGTRTVVDTGSLLSVNGGNLVTDGRTGSGDPALWLDAVTRAAGVLVVGHVNQDNTSNRVEIGWDANQTGTLTENSFYFPGSAFNINPGLPQVGSAVAGRDYYVALVLRSSGAYYFIKETNAYTNWTLMWHEATANTATVYPGIAVRTGWGSGDNNHDFLRVPDETWLPTPLAYTEFAAANGTSLDALDTLTTGPDSQAGVTARSWTEQDGAFDVQSNRANTTGADPGVYKATIDAGESDVIIDSIVNMSAGYGIVIVRYSDNSNYWECRLDAAADTVYLIEIGVATRASGSVTIDVATDYDARVVCDGQTIDCFVDGGNKITYGSASAHETETEHGIGATGVSSTFDNFTVFARDSGYSKLDTWTA